METESFGRVLVAMGLVLLAVGFVMIYFDRIPLLGRLPGDIIIRRDNFTLYIPITTGILISLLITLALWAIRQIRP